MRILDIWVVPIQSLTFWPCCILTKCALIRQDRTGWIGIGLFFPRGIVRPQSMRLLHYEAIFPLKNTITSSDAWSTICPGTWKCGMCRGWICRPVLWGRVFPLPLAWQCAHGWIVRITAPTVLLGMVRLKKGRFGRRPCAPVITVWIISR